MYRVAIPSYDRATTLRDKTLRVLLAGGVDPTRIDVYVRGQEQLELYSRTLEPGSYGRLVLFDGDPGVMPVRNFISRSYAPGTRLFQIDDDVYRIVRKIDDKLVEDVQDVDALIELGFATADEAGLYLWGLYPVKNPLFMKHRVRYDLTYIEGAIFGYTVLGDDTELVRCDDKEDFERSIRFYLRDGGVVRLESYSFWSNFYTEPGGMQTYRTVETVEAGARYLLETYPELCSYFVSRGRGMPEVRLRDRRGRP